MRPGPCDDLYIAVCVPFGPFAPRDVGGQYAELAPQHAPCPPAPLITMLINRFACKMSKYILVEFMVSDQKQADSAGLSKAIQHL